MSVRSPTRRSATVCALGCAVLLSGCSHRSRPIAAKPAPPPLPYGKPSRSGHEGDSAGTVRKPAPVPLEVPAGFFDDTSRKPVVVETGLASWYGLEGGRRRASDGSMYNQNAMTAAHRTLPLGSTVRVTNLTSGEQVLVRITDRGPFVPGRMLDLSRGAAQAAGVLRAGVARVRIEAFAHPNADPLGRWCVQTGPFKAESDALDLKAALTQRYKGAKVAEFAGATGYWVRADPVSHSRGHAAAMLNWIGTPDEQATPFLVRLN